MSRTNTLRNYLTRDYLCPYATLGVTSGATVFLDFDWTSSKEREVARALLVLALGLTRDRSAGAALVLVAREDAPDDISLRRATERVLRLLWQITLRAQTPSACMSEVVEGADRMVRETLSNAPMRPFLTVLGQPLFLITLGASYPERHTRYAPHDCWVLTRVAEVAETAHRQPTGVAAIRTRIVERMGELYDADEPLLPASAMRS